MRKDCEKGNSVKRAESGREREKERERFGYKIIKERGRERIARKEKLQKVAEKERLLGNKECKQRNEKGLHES
jgi:hypothetical protein